jgi:hypothetical protein
LGRTSQLFSLDAVFAMIVISFLFGLFLSFNSSVPSTISLAESRISLQEDSQLALLALAVTPGEPSNWTSYNFSLPAGADVRSIGLASSPWVLDMAKVSALSAANKTNYTYLKSLLGLSKPDYNFYFSIKYPNGTQVGIAGLARPTPNLTSTISSQFVVADDGRVSLASLLVWVGEYK